MSFTHEYHLNTILHYIHNIYTLRMYSFPPLKIYPKSDSGPKDDYLGFRPSAPLTPIYTARLDYYYAPFLILAP